MSAPLADADLVALARAATPGPWRHTGRYIGVRNHASYIGECRDETGHWSDTAHSISNAAFIAACSPERILSLVERAQRAETDRKALLDAVELVCDAFGDISPTSPAFARCISDLHATAARVSP